MATVLVSFIGIGEKNSSTKTRSQYELVEYDFTELGWKKDKSSIFGVSLHRYLSSRCTDVEKWLVMGTRNSIWCDLINVFNNPEDIYIKDEAFGKLFDFLDKEAPKKTNPFISKIKQESQDELDINNWETKLNKYFAQDSQLKNTKISCRLVGDATDKESQEKIFQSLYDVIEESDEVVFDVTHGLRNQPIITSFVVMYLRYLKNIKAKDIKFYYGAKDLDGKVVKLDFCNELLKAAEAVAIDKQTGNYEQIGKNLKLSEQFNEKLEKLVFLDEVNKTNPDIPNQLNDEISNAQLSPLQISLAKRFGQPLHYASKKSLSEQLRQKALFAFERKQYYKAILILLEAVIVVYGEMCGNAEIAGNLELHFYRDKSERQLLGQEYGIPTGLNSHEIQTFKNLKKLRNAIAHGTDANGIETEAIKAREAVEDENKLKQIFNDGNNLFAKIIKGEIGR